ncbi:hypothetical protein JCM11641_008191 [Rhodosporidiobolus odoratus]
MRQKRVKSYRKVMHLYQQAFGFREPYQLLVDAAFVKACVQQKLDVMSRLQDVLQGAVKPMITQCCITALYEGGDDTQAAVDAAKGFERRKCNHFKARPEEECILAMAGAENKNRYVFATQSLDLRQNLRKVPGSPIIYIARSVMLLESPSDQTMQKKIRNESAKLHVSAEELSQITGQPLPSPPSEDDEPAPATTANADGGVSSEEPKKKKRQRGPKGPNPLSVKKKKAVVDPAKAQRPSKRLREEEDGARGSGLTREEREMKRKREEEGKVVSMAPRGGGGEGERKKRKRRRKVGADGGDAATGGDGARRGEGDGPGEGAAATSGKGTTA